MDEPVLYHPWGVVSPAFWAGSEAQTPPDTPSEAEAQEPGQLRAPAASDAAASDAETPGPGPDVYQGLATIQEAVAAGRHGEAQALAEALDQAVTAVRGEVDLDTIQIREVRGYLADLTGDPAKGLDWYLHTLRLRSRLHGPDSPDTDAAARRAYSLWRTLPADEAQNAAGSLLAAINQAQGPDAVAARWTRLRSAELAVLPRSPAV